MMHVAGAFYGAAGAWIGVMLATNSIYHRPTDFHAIAFLAIGGIFFTVLHFVVRAKRG